MKQSIVNSFNELNKKQTMHEIRIERRRLHNHLFLAISILLILIGFVSVSLLKSAKKLKELEKNRFLLYALSNELKESSEELTKYCRNYVLTGDSVWEQKYWRLLDIRNGKMPRADGRTIALKDSLLKLGIVKEEFEKLSLAEKNSNDLVRIEKVAFDATKGVFVDTLNNTSIHAKQDTLFARKILFDENYHNIKKSIMQPISDFSTMLDKRTSLEVEKQNSKNELLIGLIGLIILLTFILSFYAIIILRKQIMNQIAELQKTNQVISANEEDLLQQNEEITTLFDNLKEANTKLAELNATKDKFFSIIAHDLKSPFNTLLNFNSLLIDNLGQSNSTETLQLAKSMNKTVTRTYKLLENLLVWANIQTGKIEPMFISITPSKLVNEIKHLIEPLAKNKNMKFETLILSDQPICVDVDMVKTILRNLTSNAIKYTYPNGIVKIEAQKSGSNILFCVSDTGMGIEPEFIENIFHVGNNLSKTGTDGELGTGLGLVLCKEFVEKNNGEIWIESEVGKGSSFKFTMPLCTN